MTAAEKICWHAGFGETGLVPHTVSAATAGGSPAEIEAAAADFVALLGDYNLDLNGQAPSSTSSPGSDTVLRDVAYAVSEVTRMLRESGAGQSAWRVETAWLAVLAGDIDDVGEHVVSEEATREP